MPNKLISRDNNSGLILRVHKLLILDSIISFNINPRGNKFDLWSVEASFLAIVSQGLAKRI